MDGDWIWNIDGINRVLYRLPELLKYPDACVFVCEGEKDADRVASLNHCATAVACGKWTDDCVKALAGRDVLILEDNDDAGRKKALEATQALHGTAKTIRIVRLPNLSDKGDVSDWLDADARNASKFADFCFDAPLWTPVSAEAAAATGDSVLGAAKALPFIDMSRWDTEPAPSREWAAENRIPLKQPYLFTGHGAVGKSLVELMRACAHALNKLWLGMPVAHGPVIYMGAEDDADELHRRLEDILSYYGANFADAIAGGLHLLSYIGEDCMLGIPDRSGIIRATPLFQQLEQAAMDIKPVAVMLDTVSDVFGGSEIDRGHVTQFIKMIQGMAFRTECSMSILAHPSNAGMATGTGLSGSTGWHNRVRARAYMKALETPKGEEPNPDLREIQFLKNNYGRQGDSIQVRWQRGVYVLEGAPSSLEKLAQDQRDDERFVELLQRYDSQGRKVSESKTANNYAPKQFAEEKGPDGKMLPLKRFEQAMQRLFTASKIHIQTYGRPSRPYKYLALGPKQSH
jgi:RecA-family ATPase